MAVTKKKAIVPTTQDDSPYFTRVQQRIASLSQARAAILAKCEGAKSIVYRAVEAISSTDYDLDIARQRAKIVYRNGLEQIVTALLPIYRRIHDLTGATLNREIARWHSHHVIRGKDAVEEGVACIDMNGVLVSVAVYEP
ncbi:MAG: hypothetical protein GYA24_02780, partial [Candidatus Lokiarchaeota archaeon]|nr:hypothetical protein [Candidatus Lokiarchaeota archaeon]